MGSTHARPTATWVMVVALTLLPSSLSGQDAEYGPCMDAAESQVEMGVCRTDALARADAELNAAYRGRRAFIDESGHLSPEVISDWKTALRDAQRAWIAFRDADCNQVEYEAWGGSGMGQTRTMCLLRRTVQRTSELGGSPAWRSSSAASEASGSLSGEIALRDPTEWDNSLWAGPAVSLYVGDEFVVQIDADFGAHRVPGGLLYNPIDSIDEGYSELGPGDVETWVPIWMTQPAGPVRDDGAGKTPLRSFVPMFVDMVSCPALSPPWMFYWGWTDEGAHAAAYDFATGTSVSTLLGPVQAETDVSCLLGSPRVVGDTGEFEFEGEIHGLKVGSSR